MPQGLSYVVDTTPSGPKRAGVNMGLEIARSETEASVAHYREVVDLDRSGSIGFNIFYPLNVLNVAPFLRANGIEPDVDKREDLYITCGGAGAVSNPDVLGGIVNDVFMGEIDGVRSGDWFRAESLVSAPVVSGNRGVIELTRGCKYRCTFCEYGHVLGGVYREKDIDLVKGQIDSIADRVGSVNFMSANVAGYSGLDELMEHCLSRGVRVSNSDMCHKDMDKYLKWAKVMNVGTLRIGLESLNESTRGEIKKGITDARLFELLGDVLKDVKRVYFYLIYGLPGDDYGRWIDMVGELARFRDSFGERNLLGDVVNRPQFVFSVTDFQPMPGTPLANAPQVCYNNKHKFVPAWFNELIKYDYVRTKRKCDTIDKMVEVMVGRLGMRPKLYEMLMTIRRGDWRLTNALINGIPAGTSQFIAGRQIDNFMRLAINWKGVVANDTKG